MCKRKIMHVLFIYICMAELRFRCLNITMHTEVVIYSMNAYVWLEQKSVAHLMKSICYNGKL